ncbi:carbohydrate ABC transporter permease [Paenibacillus sp. N1-5-1-14]|uniref:carbohydrate ABC transporter permease n=1 Tax=Paenibacillus radicibacter TaxID=2972488 RepID=UPI002159815C|nr:carbohydrate ABC transporter permease [Paenibacillus radicibacter]MCR8642519.1 carbohydrate ABC transporter permease [Paenibacillus radicibacter]
MEVQNQPIKSPKLSLKRKRKEVNNNAITPFWNVVLNIIIGLFAFSCVFPFLFVIAISFTDEMALTMNGFSLFPEKFSLEAYKFVFQTGDQLFRSFGVTVMVTVLGTLISLFLITTYAYVISRRSFRYRNFFSFFAFFTMLFSGGMVPGYIVVTQFLHVQNTILALILPQAMNAFFILVMRTFFQTTVPDALVEAAKIDGAGEMRTFAQIVLPISLPGIATIGLFSTLGYWNDWFNALLYIDKANLVPLQALLMRIQNNMEFVIQNSMKMGGSNFEIAATMPKETVRMAMVVLATLPIALAYPFFQKYFVQGLTVGSLKE